MKQPIPSTEADPTRREATSLLVRLLLLTPLGILFVLGVVFLSFFSIENWRGKRAWTKYKQQLEAKGEKLDPLYFAPPVANDDENFYKAPRMAEWFKRQYSSGSNIKLPIDWPKDWDKSASNGPIVAAPNDVTYPASVLTNWFEEQHADEFKCLELACERPKTDLGLELSKSSWWVGSSPHFVNYRQMAQILAARSAAYIKLDRPDLALHDLTLLRRLMDSVVADPTLVSVMIHVAIGGLYIGSVQEGLQSNKWSEDQIRTIEQQLRSMDFVPAVDHSFRSEVARVTYMTEKNSAADMFHGSSIMATPKSLSSRIERMLERSTLNLFPRGWLYQNMIVYARTMHENLLQNVDPVQRRVYPQRCQSNSTAIDKMARSSGAYSLLARIAIPNFVKAAQSLCRNQAAAHQAALVCALERFKRAEGKYPEKLEDLQPRFVAEIPHDVITGKPYLYHRLENGTFLLYAVGWDEKDNGGTKADWVWPDLLKAK